jgi:hypothetical protein
LPTAGTVSQINMASTGLTAYDLLCLRASNCGSSFENWILRELSKHYVMRLLLLFGEFCAFPSGTVFLHSLPD